MGAGVKVEHHFQLAAGLLPGNHPDARAKGQARRVRAVQVIAPQLYHLGRAQIPLIVLGLLYHFLPGPGGPVEDVFTQPPGIRKGYPVFAQTAVPIQLYAVGLQAQTREHVEYAVLQDGCI